jgi:hypothetical protein
VQLEGYGSLLPRSRSPLTVHLQALSPGGALSVSAGPSAGPKRAQRERRQLPGPVRSACWNLALSPIGSPASEQHRSNPKIDFAGTESQSPCPREGGRGAVRRSCGGCRGRGGGQGSRSAACGVGAAACGERPPVAAAGSAWSGHRSGTGAALGDGGAAGAGGDVVVGRRQAGPAPRAVPGTGRRLRRRASFRLGDT